MSDEPHPRMTKLFSITLNVQIGPSGITATVLIANLLMEEAHLIHEVSHGELFSCFLGT